MGVKFHKIWNVVWQFFNCVPGRLGDFSILTKARYCTDVWQKKL
jgi:hypothetical protein